MRNTISYAKIDDFGLFRCEHKRGPSGQVKFAITKRRTNASFKSLSPLRNLTQKKKKYSDCKIFGKKVKWGLLNLFVTPPKVAVFDIDKVNFRVFYLSYSLPICVKGGESIWLHSNKVKK